MSDLLAGAAYLVRGLVWIARRPGLWLLGLIPALIVAVVYLAALVVLVVNLDDLATAATPFAATWSEGWRQVVHVVAIIGIFGAAMLVALVTFTAVTLIVGQPFYERISERVEESVAGDEGVPAAPAGSLARRLVRAARDGLAVACLSAIVGISLLVLGFVPVLGQTVIPVVGAAVSGFFLTSELTGIALERRGVGVRRRFALLRAERWLAIGFGALTVAVFLVPLAAVVVMPGAVAGSTLLVRERLADSARASGAAGSGRSPGTAGSAGPAGSQHGGTPNSRKRDGIESARGSVASDTTP
jgi:CysZ protein